MFPSIVKYNDPIITSKNVIYTTFINCLTYVKKLECSGNETLVDVTCKYLAAYLTTV